MNKPWLRYGPALPVLLSLCILLSPATGQDATKKDDTKKSGPGRSGGSRITVHIKLTAEGATTLPQGSFIEMKGDEQRCAALDRKSDLDAQGNVQFRDLPVCKVVLKIFVTGFETQKAPVDLSRYKDAPILIHINSTGVPTLLASQRL